MWVRGSGLIATKAAVPLLVLVAGLGLLTMHALSVPEHNPMMHAAVAVAVPTSDARIGPDTAPMDGHMHQLLGCLWIIVGGITIALLSCSATRLREMQRHANVVVHGALSSAQRAPPTALRLSLVGVSRR